VTRPASRAATLTQWLIEQLAASEAGSTARVRTRDARLVTGVLEAVAVGVVVFASTNADDLVLLAAFFSDERVHPRAVVLGQFIGIGILTAISFGAALGATALPAPWVALLGVIPLGLGLWKLARLRVRGAAPADDEHAPDGARASHVLAVAGSTIANGGDNLGVYVPLFASRPSAVVLYVTVFAVLTAVWCLLGWWIVRNRSFGQHVRRYGRVVLPFVLIAVGLHVLRGAAPLAGR
jgi:cadmium resistance protein CadD (predicted permease)